MTATLAIDVDFDLDKLTDTEKVDLVKVVGFDPARLDDLPRSEWGDRLGKLVAGLIWIYGRRQDPAFTFGDACVVEVGDCDFTGLGA